MLKKISYYLLSIIIFLLVAIASVRIYLQWTHQYHYGRITEVGNNSFSIQVTRDEFKSVLVSEKTIVKRGGKTTLEDLRVGRSVIVIGPINSKGEVEATLVRMIKPNR